MNATVNTATLEAPVVKILGNVESRQQQTKNGARTVYFQLVQVECEQLRMRTEHEVDSPNHGLPVGSQHAWDVVADLVPGNYGSFDIARRKTLRPLDTTPARVAGAKTTAQ